LKENDNEIMDFNFSSRNNEMLMTPRPICQPRKERTFHTTLSASYNGRLCVNFARGKTEFNCVMEKLKFATAFTVLLFYNGK
jgi:hypothetical protein